MNAEELRLAESRARTHHWKRWGPYLAERAWGTVREDYSPGGNAWDYFPHDHARSRAYRWNEDGLAGICDRHQEICFALALWNGHDSILKERLFGLGGSEGNHGEDVKEYYYYLDSTPTHSYMKFLYKYPQSAFPYADLAATNRRRSRNEPEYELIDTGVFAGNRYFDVFVEYAKADVEDIHVRIQVFNRGPEAAVLHLAPTVWFRNTWSWGDRDGNLPHPLLQRGMIKPSLQRVCECRHPSAIELETERYGKRYLYCEAAEPSPPTPFPEGEGSRTHPGSFLATPPETGRERGSDCGGVPRLLFTENETNFRRLYGVDGPSPYAKDGIGRYIVEGVHGAVNPEQVGTKAAAHYLLSVEAGGMREVWLRLTDELPDRIDHRFGPPAPNPGGVGLAEPSLPSELSSEVDRGGLPGPVPPGLGVRGPKAEAQCVVETRRREADEFYAEIIPSTLSDDARNVMRQALAGMLWSKQYYHYVVDTWLGGDPAMPAPSQERSEGRNKEWGHVYNNDILSMPDKWEYPWFAAWDLAFHCLPLALADSDFAKDQLSLIVREWYMHPNGQIPAYEWEFSDVNPPVHAWAAWRVYKMEEKRTGVADRQFLERVFHKLLLNFTWWVNRKDAEGMNIFQGGFLGLDNIGVFDRSRPLPTGGHIEQSDGTSWMAMYTLNLLTIAIELARENPVYEDVASKFYEHFLRISHAMNNLGGEGVGLWDREDGFFYDVLHLPSGERRPMRVRSIVGLIPLFAVDTLEPEVLERCASFRKRMEWFIEHRPDLTDNVAGMDIPGVGERRLLSIISPSQLRGILQVMLDETEFLSPYGIRALSRRHLDEPYSLRLNGDEYKIGYEPAESTNGLFGGNSNWRGPVWIPVNYLIIESLQKFHYYLGDDFKIECPTGSGIKMTLWEVAADLSRRLTRIFLRDADGRRPVHGDMDEYATDPHWRDLVLFYEYFHGDNGTGVGASHQTGWTGLVAKLLQQSGE